MYKKEKKDRKKSKDKELNVILRELNWYYIPQEPGVHGRRLLISATDIFIF